MQVGMHRRCQRSMEVQFLVVKAAELRHVLLEHVLGLVLKELLLRVTWQHIKRILVEDDLVSSRVHFNAAHVYLANPWVVIDEHPWAHL